MFRVNLSTTIELSPGDIGRVGGCSHDLPPKSTHHSASNTIEILCEDTSSDDAEQPRTIKRRDSITDISESVQIESIQHEEKSIRSITTLSLSVIGEPLENTLSDDSFIPVAKNEKPARESEWGDLDFWRSSTLLIETRNLPVSSFAGELLCSIKLDSLIILCFVCGVGYQGRLTISKWFGILETIHHWPIAIGVAAFADAACIISKVELFKIFTIGLILFYYVDLILFVRFADVLYGHLINNVAMSTYVLLVYVYCSNGFHVRARWVIIYIVSCVILVFATIAMLYLKLWTAILLAIIPADFMLNKIVVEATKTCDRLLFLDINAIIYCALFENVRYQSVLGLIDEEMDYTLKLAEFAAIDVLCIFISKSEILTYINFHTQWFGKESKTWLLAGRVTRACVTITTLSWPIWNIGFELGRFLMNPDRNITEFVKKTELVLVMNYIPELLSEIALYIYLKCLPFGKYKYERLNFVSSLSSFYLAAYCMIPGVLAMFKILTD